MSEVIRVPDIGSDSAVDVIEVNVKAGDVIEPEQTIVVLESEKASVEVPAPQGGKVVKVLVNVGDRVNQDDPLLELDAAGAAEEPEETRGEGTESEAEKESQSEQKPGAEEEAGAESEEKEEATPEAGQANHEAVKAPQARARESEENASRGAAGAKPVPQAAAATADTSPASEVYAGPAVRKLAREMGVDLSRVKASGPRGRITPEDVHAFVKVQLERPQGSSPVAELPDIDFSRFGETERVELGKIRKLTAKNLHRNWQVIPHVTQHEEADITELEAFRKRENECLAKQGTKLTMLAFLAKASSICLKSFPDFNSSLENNAEFLVRKKYVNIGVAVDTENGLVVPVVRDVDRKGVVEIAGEVAALAEKARAGKLAPKDMQGASFSISSLGGIGGTAFTPIVNWPEVAILGASRADLKPKWNGKEFEPRLMLPLSLSYDHRVIDGADAARFCVRLAEILSDFRRAAL